MLLVVAALASACRRAPIAAPAGVGKKLVATSRVEEIIRSVDPSAKVHGGVSGGGGSGLHAGKRMHASYEYLYSGRIKTEAPLGSLLVALRRELRSDIQKNGGVVYGVGGGPTTETRSNEPQRVLRTAENMQFRRQGFEADLFVVAYPVAEVTVDYVLLIRVVEIFTGE